MPGVNLSLDLPQLSDPLATVVSKTAAALTAIQNDLTPKVTAGALNINAALPFNGNPATGLGSIQLSAGNTPTAAGSIYYASGEFWAIDATGTIQLTSMGNLNAAGLAGIVGDYGGTNPARVTYVNASGQYQFTTAPGAYADLVARSVILEGSAGSVQMGVDAALTGSKTANWKSLPSSGVSFLVYKASTGTIEDGAVTNVSNPLVSTAAITASALKFTTGVQVNLPAGEALALNGALATLAFDGTYGSPASWNLNGDVKPIVWPLRLPAGAQILAYGVRASNLSGSTKSIHVQLVQSDGSGGGTLGLTDPDSGNVAGYDSPVNNVSTNTTAPTSTPNIAALTGGKQTYLLARLTNSADTFRVFWGYVTYIVP